MHSNQSEKITKASLLLIGLIMSSMTFVIGFLVAKTGVSGEVAGDLEYALKGSLNSPEERNIDFSTFWDVWNELETEYVDEDLDEKQMFEGAIKGLVDSLDDPATFYFSAEETREYEEQLAGKFEGIGAELGYLNGRIIVKMPLEGSPAEKAGLLPGDVILKVDGEDISGLNIHQVVLKIHGDAGTEVKLTVFRPGEEKEIEIPIVRDEIHVDSVMYYDEGDGIYRIRLLRFTEDTPDAFYRKWDEVVSEVLSKDPRGLIIDVRGNSGGYLDGGIYVAEEFLPMGKAVLQIEVRDGEKTTRKVDRKGKFRDIPVLVMVDEGTASASEIFAGAIQKNGRAKVLGEKTVGKGTAQEIIKRPGWEGASLHITVQKWLLPDGVWLNEENPIVPDIEVENSVEDFKEGNDPQLSEALEVVRKMVE